MTTGQHNSINCYCTSQSLHCKAEAQFCCDDDDDDDDDDDQRLMMKMKMMMMMWAELLLHVLLIY